MSIHARFLSGPSPSRRQLLAGIAVTFLMGTASLAHAAAPGMPPGLNAPTKPTSMPAFELPTLTGQPLRSETLKGQVLVIRFWASW